MYTRELLFASAALISSASAYPFMNLPGAGLEMAKRSGYPDSARQVTFDAKSQLVDVTGDHAFRAPGSGDLRGPCPGLNALANHGYLPHNGVVTLAQAVEATNTVFGMGIDLGTFLSTYATVIDGNPLTQTWSIGGAPSGGLLGGLLSAPQGLSGSHNKYESDASPGRGDAYLNNGDASSLSVPNFQKLYALQSGDAGGDYNLGVLIQHAQQAIDYSRQYNPQFFWGPFTGLVVSQAAFSFIPAFMSNHSAAQPQGFLDQDVLKSFFGVTGTQGSLSYQRGHEQIPANWYRRAVGMEYTIPAFAIDNQIIQLAVPERVAVGGNLGTAGSFAGVDLSDLTGGVYNSQNILQGNNAVCLGYEVLLTVVPDVLKGLVSDVAGALNLFTSKVSPTMASLNCPQLSFYNKDLVSKFPGAGAAI